MISRLGSARLGSTQIGRLTGRKPSQARPRPQQAHLFQAPSLTNCRQPASEPAFNRSAHDRQAVGSSKPSWKRLGAMQAPAERIVPSQTSTHTARLTKPKASSCTDTPRERQTARQDPPLVYMVAARRASNNGHATTHRLAEGNNIAAAGH